MKNARMRFLLVSDSHGQLGLVDGLAVHTQSDAVIHAGDFGFYDDGSYDRLSDETISIGRRIKVTAETTQKVMEKILDRPCWLRAVPART